MSIVNSIRSQLAPIHPEGYPFIGAFALVEPDPVLAVAAARLARHGADAVVRLFLPRSAAGDAGARRPRGGAGRRPHQPDHDARCRRTSSASATTPLPRISIFMSVFDCHVNRSPVAGRIETIVYHAGQVPQRRSRQGERATTSATRWSSPRPAAAHRRGADRRAGRAPHRLLRARGPAGRRRRALRHDPLRLAPRRLSAGGRAAAGRASGRPRSPAKPCSPICRAADAGRAFRAG